MDETTRLQYLRYIYANARRQGRRIDPHFPSAGYRLNLDMISVEIKAEPKLRVRLYANMMPCDYAPGPADQLFDFRQFVYEGCAKGLEAVMIDRFGLKEDGTVHPHHTETLRFRCSKDNRELTEKDRKQFDILLSYCADQGISFIE